MRNEINRVVREFRKEFGIKNVSGYSLKKAASDMGYTVIYFNNVLNDKNVTELIEALGLSLISERSKGFTYTDDNYRLIFIHEELADKEAAVVLAHELGHIRCGHLKKGACIGSDVSEEFEANEFAHYLLTPGVSEKIKKFISGNKKTVAAVLVILVVAAAGFFTVKTVNAKTHYYITETGFKYHKKDCVFVKNKDNVTCVSKQFLEDGNYTPCEMCLSGK